MTFPTRTWLRTLPLTLHTTFSRVPGFTLTLASCAIDGDHGFSLRPSSARKDASTEVRMRRVPHPRYMLTLPSQAARLYLTIEFQRPAQRLSNQEPGLCGVYLRSLPGASSPFRKLIRSAKASSQRKGAAPHAVPPRLKAYHTVATSGSRFSFCYEHVSADPAGRPWSFHLLHRA